MYSMEVKGLSKLNKALARASKDIPEIIEEAALSVAVTVVKAAEPTIPKRSGRAVRSLRGYVSGEGARVTGGNNETPYYRWLELGGRSGRNLAQYRPIVKNGRYLNPAYERNKAKIAKDIAKIVAKGLRKAGLEAD